MNEHKELIWIEEMMSIMIDEGQEFSFKFSKLEERQLELLEKLEIE